MNDKTTCYQRNPNVVLREEDEDGALLFNPDTNQVQVVNATAAFIWKTCDGAHTLDHILAALQEEFDETPPEDALRQEIQTYLESMEINGFLIMGLS